jgi:hypothetical protein
MTKILKAIYGSEKTPLKLGNLEIPCYVLEDGTRVFSGRGLQKAIGYESKSGQWMRSFCNMDGVSDYMNAGDDSIINRLSSPIKFQRIDAGGSQSSANGYEVTLLVDICSAVIDANRAGVFNNDEIVRNADIIIRAVAKVGIIALVDEATGYQEDKNRAKDELQKFLSQFISEEASKWVKTFNDSFFEMIYRMHGWNWTMTHKRPGVVGTWINDIVYERIGPAVLSELERANPKNEKGARKERHHQHLTEEIGRPKLKEHLAAVEALGRASGYDWAKFMQLLDTAFPKPHQQLSLLFPDDVRE